MWDNPNRQQPRRDCPDNSASTSKIIEACANAIRHSLQCTAVAERGRYSRVVDDLEGERKSGEEMSDKPMVLEN